MADPWADILARCIWASRCCQQPQTRCAGGAVRAATWEPLPEYRWSDGGYPAWAPRDPDDRTRCMLTYRHRLMIQGRGKINPTF